MAHLEQYQFGRVTVDGDEETHDFIVLPTRVVRSWWRAESHRLAPTDIADVVGELPERLIIGTGAEDKMYVEPETLDLLDRHGVLAEVLPTGEAVRRYGELDPNRTAVALHLTC